MRRAGAAHLDERLQQRLGALLAAALELLVLEEQRDGGAAGGGEVDRVLGAEGAEAARGGPGELSAGGGCMSAWQVRRPCLLACRHPRHRQAHP
jgi:hypothetical protein